MILVIREDRNHDSCALHRHKNHDICVLNPQMILLSCKNNRAQNAYLASELSFQSANEVHIFLSGPSELFFCYQTGKSQGISRLVRGQLDLHQTGNSLGIPCLVKGKLKNLAFHHCSKSGFLVSTFTKRELPWEFPVLWRSN